MDINNYIKGEVLRVHKKALLESQLKDVNEKLALLKEGNERKEEAPLYESNVYEDYKKDLSEVINSLAEACNKLETAGVKQEKHATSLPEVNERKAAGNDSKQVILDIFKEIKKAKLAAERKLYEMS